MAQELVAHHDVAPEFRYQAASRNGVGLGYHDSFGAMFRTMRCDAVAHGCRMTMIDVEPVFTQLLSKRFDGSRVQREARRVPWSGCKLVGSRDEQHTMCLWSCRCECTDISIELIAKHPHRVAWRHCADATCR